MKRVKTIGFSLMTLTLCLAVALPMMWAQGNVTRQRDPLAGLKNALSQAGAEPLSAGQESTLNGLITNLQNSRQAQFNDPAVKNAKQNLENAILGNDSAAVNSAASAMSQLLSTKIASRVQAQANFAFSAVHALSASQINALTQKFGTTGLLRVVRSLSHGGMRPRMRGFGGGPEPEFFGGRNR